MKKLILVVPFILVIATTLVLYKNYTQSGEMKSPQGETQKVEGPYEKYSFERLVTREDKVSVIELGEEIATTPEYTSYVFYYYSEGRRISGQLNLPNLSRLMGAVVMARGYVEKDAYTTGTGTRNAAAVYAKNGYITLAPDFSGYGESETEDENALGARLVKPVEVLDLIASLSSLPQIDLTRVYLWGHSNGGQITISLSEVLGERARRGIANQNRAMIRGATLWAPVTKPFPYNILYYTDEADDQGKWLRSEIAKFEAEYDVFKYSIDKYLDWIDIPLVIHQGTVDDAVPVTWSREFVKRLEEKEKLHAYYEYPGADHNMRPDWNTVVLRDLDFFNKLGGENL